MATRSAIVRFSNAAWIGATAAPFESVLRERWLHLLQAQDWQGFSEDDADAMLDELLARSGGLEFRHLPPFRVRRPTRLQGGQDLSFDRAPGAPEPRFLPLRVTARGRSFPVKGGADFDARGRLTAQLFLSGYVIVALEYELTADASVVGGQRFWQVVRQLSPNVAKSGLILEKPGLSAKPKDFVAAVFRGSSHSLMRQQPSLRLKYPWHVGVMAVRGPHAYDSELIGEEVERMLRMGPAALSAGGRGYYYVEPQDMSAARIRRRFETLRIIFDFTRYQHHCLTWAKEAAKSWHQRLRNASLIDEAPRSAAEIGEASHYAWQLNKFIDCVNAVPSSASPWQTRVYRTFSAPLGVSEKKTAFEEKYSARLAQQISQLKGRSAIARLADAAAAENDVFISYAHAEYDRIEPIIRRLEQLGLTVFVDRAGMQAGVELTVQLASAIDNSKVVLGCYTRRSLDSDTVLLECGKAMRTGKLVPILLEDVGDKLKRGFADALFAERVVDANDVWSDAAWVNVLDRIALLIETWCVANPDHEQKARADETIHRLRAAAPR